MNPHQVTRDFERELCAYTGAPYSVTTTSCTMALLLAVAWHRHFTRWIAMEADNLAAYLNRPFEIEIPKRTYVGVPMSIIHAGGRPVFRDSIWFGAYQLKPLPVWDSARYFTSGMYYSKLWNTELQPHEPGIHSVDGSGAMLCVSFHTSKILADTQGGAILHDSAEADAWLRRARFDGRTEGVAPKDDRFDMLGWHCYLSPDVAARLMWKLSVLPKHNEPLPNDAYPDLSQMEIFR